MGCVAVFGGSGRLGEVIVRHLAVLGPVRFTYFSQREPAEALVRVLKAEGADVEAEPVDVRNAAAVEAFLQGVAADKGLSAVVSANGGLFPVCPLHEVDEADFRRIMDVDVFGSFHIMKSATPLLAANGGGAIIMLLTAAVLRTIVYDGMSSVPKAALANMIRQLARDAGPLNVRVNGIAPGVVDTDKVANIDSLPPYKREMASTFTKGTPLQRFNNPNTIAALAAFLTTDVPADISGQIIGADGGYSA